MILTAQSSSRTVPFSGLDAALRDELQRVRDVEKLSHGQIARGIGRSTSAVSLYLSGKYGGSVDQLQHRIREWLRTRGIIRKSGVETIETELSRQMARHIDETRDDAELCVIAGVAGIGKSRGADLYVDSHPLASKFRVVAYRRGNNAIAQDLCEGAGISLRRGQKRWPTIVSKTTGSGRIFIVDDAHELTNGGLQCFVDFHEETGNPVVLVGLPSLLKRLMRDSRRARRVGKVFNLAIEEREPLINHLIDQLVPGVKHGDRDELFDLCIAVSKQSGMFGAVEKQLKAVARYQRKDPSLGAHQAFVAAHQRLIRDYTLATSALMRR